MLHRVRRFASSLILLPALLVTGCASTGLHLDPPAPRKDANTTAPASTAHLVAELPRPASDAEKHAPPAPAPAIERPTPVAVPIEGSELVRGRSTTQVAASLEKTREAVLDFAHYADFMPHYRNAKVLGRTETGARDVYMEVEALFGAVSFWAEVEMPKAQIIDGVETWETHFRKGNVKDFKAIWRLKKIDATTTELSLEVFLHPSLPLPVKLVNDENLKGSSSGVAAMRGRAEQLAK
jgi:ribosome-associated toxin RatA of RatAB toxin-antitoxin module